jgi:excisionase family DNA binding protein
MTVKDISKYLQVSPALVYKWAHYRFIPCVKIGSLLRFKESQIDTWIKRKERKGRTSYKIHLENL